MFKKNRAWYIVAAIGYIVALTILWNGWVKEDQLIHWPGYDEYVIPCDTDIECRDLNPHLGEEFIK